MTSSAAPGVAQPTPDEIVSRSSSLFLFLIVAIFIAARIWRLTASCLWFDEIFGIHAARYNWKQMFQFVAADLIHPPLFYALLKIWIAIGGESLLWLRLLPALLSIAAIVPIVLLCRALKLNSWQMNLAVALLAVNGYLIKYAQEIRMYSLLFLLTTTSLWLCVRFTDPASTVRRILPALLLVNLLLVYSHYYGWVVVFAELLFILLWRRERLIKFLLTIFALILSYLPWLYLITISKEPGRGLAQNIGWVTRPGLSDVAQFFSMLNTPFFFRQSSANSATDIWGTILSVIVFGVPVVIFFWRAMKDKRIGAASEIWILGFVILPIVLVFVLSWVLPHSVWGTRHLIVTAVPYAILAALALSELRITWLRTTCLVLLGFWVVLNGAVTLWKRPPNLTWCTWEPLARQVVSAETNASQPIDVYAFEDLVAYHLWFAFANANREGHSVQFKVHVVKGVPGLQEDPAYFLPRRFYEIETHDGAILRGDSIWLAFRDKQWNPTQAPLSLIAAQGFETGRVFELRAQGQQSFLVELRRTGQTR